MPRAAIKSARRQKSKWFLVSSLPKINSAKITPENRVYIHPVVALGDNRYISSPEWKLVGWNDAPFRGCGQHAIVYECLESKEYEIFEVGQLYWGHGQADKMMFSEKLTGELADEFDAWNARH